MQRSDHDKSPEGGNDSYAPFTRKHSATALHQPGLAAESLQPLVCFTRGSGLHGKVVFVAQQGNSDGQHGYTSFIRLPAFREGYWFSYVKMHYYKASPFKLAVNI